MTRSVFRKWLWVHKWSSLVCTLFLLLICLSGLPLIFNDEIDNWLDDGLPYADVPAGTPNASLDRFADLSRKMYPGEVIVSIFIDDDEPRVVVLLAPSWQAFHANPKVGHWIRFDAHTAQVLKRTRPMQVEGQTFTDVMLRLHKDLFAGLPGELFMGSMALLFVAAIVSGVVIYGPFMRKLRFGTVRADRSRRLKWLDLHNMLGVVTVAWLLVVGGTGAINELSTPLFALWQQTDVKAMLEPFKGKSIPAEAELASVQSALDTAKAAVPHMNVFAVIFPGAEFGTPYHYLFWAKGREPLTSRLFSPLVVDARSGMLHGVVEMPWYLRVLEVSRPLHFGDYGGLPLKVIWALLDVATTIILGSGLYLWWGQRRSSADALEAGLAECRLPTAALEKSGAAE